jgi:hypothetical protein
MLIVKEKSDIIFYTNNSFYLEQHLPNAQLILYPDATRGSCFSNLICSSNTRALSCATASNRGRSGVSLGAKSPMHSLTPDHNAVVAGAVYWARVAGQSRPWK